MDKIIRKINEQEDEALTLAYTDDVVVISKIVAQLQEVLNKQNSELRDAGMKINKRKAAVMIVSRQNDKIEVSLDDPVLELVDHLKYQSVMINDKFKMETQINIKMDKFSQMLD